MRLTTEALTLFFLLVPGFVSSAVLNALVVRQTTGRASYVIEALVFSFLIYACLAPFFGGSSVRQLPGGSVSRPGRTEMRRKENSMGNKPAGSGAGAREPIEIEERGYNPPPVAKVERPTPSPAAPRPSPRAPAPREHS